MGLSPVLSGQREGKRKERGRECKRKRKDERKRIEEKGKRKDSRSAHCRQEGIQGKKKEGKR